MVALETSEIVALSLGLSIFAFFFGSYLFYSVSNLSKKSFYIKKWLLITFVLLLNAGACALVYYTQNLQVILFVIVVLKSKDLIMSLMFVFNMIYRYFFQYTRFYMLPEASATDVLHNVVSFVPVYKESREQVQKTTNSVLNSKLGSGTHMAFVVFDGGNVFDILDSVKETKLFTYKSWKGDDVEVVVNYGLLSNKPVVTCMKHTNFGKKDSIVLVHDLFNYPRENLPSKNRDLKQQIKQDIQKHFGITGFDFIFGIDSDTCVEENGIHSLLDTLIHRDATAVSALVNVDVSSGNWFWNRLQNFQYLYGQYLRRSNEDLLSQVLCLPGCGNMVKVSPLFSKTLEFYTTTPNESEFLQTTVQNMGTDRRFTSSLVYNSQGAKILQDTRSKVYTVSPQSFSSFVSQRQRWNHNMFFNSILNCFGKNVHWLSRLFNAIDVLRMSLIYFRLFNTLFFIYVLSVNYTVSNVVELVPYIVLLSYPVFCFFVYALFDKFLRQQFGYLLLFLVPNKLFTTFTNLIVFSCMLFNIGNYKW